MTEDGVPRRGLLATVASLGGYAYISNSGSDQVAAPMPGDDSILEVPSGEKIVITSTDSDSYEGIDWETAGMLEWQQGGQLRLENTA